MIAMLTMSLSLLAIWWISMKHTSLCIAGNDIRIPAPWVRTNLSKGNWQLRYFTELKIDNGWFRLWGEPPVSTFAVPPPRDTASLLHDGYIQLVRDSDPNPQANQWDIHWDTPQPVKFDWTFKIDSTLEFELGFHGLIAAFVVAIPPFIWIYCSLKRLLIRRIRLQTNLCLHCGQNLTGVKNDKCPECGADRPLVTVSSQF
ncbi:MAG: hypothetical protein AAGA25_06640 [Planctomycetota bacterium]